MKELTAILADLSQGRDGAMDQLLRLVDAELRQLAAARLRNERSAITLQVTELVHEAFLRLSPDGASGEWQSRAHFFGAASEAMRRILVDHARKRRAQKRGGGAAPLELQSNLVADDGKADELLAVHEALQELEQHDEAAARLVKLRYFVGMQHQEAAEVLGLSRRAADRLWLIAKAWLFNALDPNQDGPQAD